MMVILFLLLAFIPEYPAFLFPGLGGGCGCCPPPPPPCPQLTLPCPPPPPCLCAPPPPPCPCLPPLQLPCPPQPCSCGCKRKKRSSPLAAVAAENGTSSEALCNNKQIRKIILKEPYQKLLKTAILLDANEREVFMLGDPIIRNLNSDPKLSKAAIYSELKTKQPGDYVVMCSQSNFSFTADSTNYCVDGSADQTCYVFQI